MKSDAESWSNNYAMLKDFYEDRMENEAENIKQCGDWCRDTANNYSQLKSMYFEMKLASEKKDKEIEKLKSDNVHLVRVRDGPKYETSRWGNNVHQYGYGYSSEWTKPFHAYNNF